MKIPSTHIYVHGSIESTDDLSLVSHQRRILWECRCFPQALLVPGTGTRNSYLLDDELHRKVMGQEVKGRTGVAFRLARPQCVIVPLNAVLVESQRESKWRTAGADGAEHLSRRCGHFQWCLQSSWCP